MTLDDALAHLRQNPSLARTFATDPAGVLGQLGVDMNKVKIGKPADMPNATPAPLGDSNCNVSVGCVVCYTTG